MLKLIQGTEYVFYISINGKNRKTSQRAWKKINEVKKLISFYEMSEELFEELLEKYKWTVTQNTVFQIFYEMMKISHRNYVEWEERDLWFTEYDTPAHRIMKTLDHRWGLGLADSYIEAIKSKSSSEKMKIKTKLNIWYNILKLKSFERT